MPEAGGHHVGSRGRGDERRAAKVLGIESFGSAEAEACFGTLVPWSYGTGWGAVRGALGTLLTPLQAGPGPSGCRAARPVQRLRGDRKGRP